MAIFEERRAVDVPEAARELGASVRTVYRDLSVLERFGVPIYPEKRGARSRWRVMEGFRRRLNITLSWPEMLALTVGRDLLSGASGSTFHESAISALDKVRAALPPELVRRADTLSNGVTAIGGAQRDYGRTRAAVTELIEAIEKQETVRLVYRAPRQKRPHERTLDPHHLHLQTGAIYVIGYVHEHGELRTCLVDRIVEVAGTGRRFDRRKEFRPQDFLQGALGPWSGRPVQIELRFAPEVAPYVGEKKVHPSQASQLRDDGALDVTLNAPVSPQLVRWLMGFGAEVQVLGPKALAERIRHGHQAASNGTR